MTRDRPVGLVRVGVEASGYHLPLVAPGALPSAWEAVEFNPAHVAEQRRTNGKRGVKTDVVDATAMFDLLVAGRGSPVGTATPAITELAAWVRHWAEAVAASTGRASVASGWNDSPAPADADPVLPSPAN